MDKYIANKIAEIAIAIKDVKEVNDTIGVIFKDDKKPGCFFCNAVRFGLMTEEEAEQFEMHDGDGWFDQGIDDETASDFLFFTTGEEGDMTGYGYYLHAQRLLASVGYPNLIKEKEHG